MLCHDVLSLKSTSRWSYRGRIINPHLRSVSKQLKLQTNSYSECAPQDMWDYITGCWKLNSRMHVLNRLKASSIRWIYGPSFPLDSLRLELPDAYGPGLLRAGPSGEERCTPHHTVPVLSSVPSWDRSANPASVPGRSSFLRALLSVSSAQKRSVAERLAAPLGVSRAARAPFPCRSSASGHQASSSKSSQVTFISIELLTIQIVTKHFTISK